MRNYRGQKDGRNTLVVSLVILSGTALVFGLLFAFGESLIKTYQRDKIIAEFRAENKRLAMESEQQFLEKLFLESEQYKDKWAKERKNKVNLGEQVIILPSSQEQSLKERFQGLTDRELQIEILKSRPNREQWWEYFFGEKI